MNGSLLWSFVNHKEEYVAFISSGVIGFVVFSGLHWFPDAVDRLQLLFYIPYKIITHYYYFSTLRTQENKCSMRSHSK